MTTIFPSFGDTKYIVETIADDICVDETTVAISDAIAGGVGVVTATWSAFNAVLDGQLHYIPAGTHDLNAADVASPTTYYVYFILVAGVPTCTSSTSNPVINPAVDEYFITNIVRFDSIATVVRYYIAKFPTQNGVYELAHNIKEDSMFFPPEWISGIAPTYTKATGKLSTDAGYVRFPGNEPRAQAAITNGSFIIDDESGIVDNLISLTTYADGVTSIGDGKWVKFLVGVNRDKSGILDAEYRVMRQSEPSVEYASEAEAKADYEGVAATNFGLDYKAAVTPICYITGKMVAGVPDTIDFTTGVVYDVRETGVVGAGGGGAAASNHSTLSNLNADDHLQYLRTDGTRALTGAWDAGSFEIRAETFESDVATGTAPLTVASTTVVTNLNADTVDGIQGANILLADGTVPLTANWDVGAFKVTANQLASDVAIGTAPLEVTSTTVVTNLNADTVDAHHAAAFLHVDGTETATGNLNMGSKSITAVNDVGTATVTATGLAKALTFESTQATGTAPLVVASTTAVTNLNADLLDGNHAAAFAVAAKGVTNGDTHDHSGGDGAQIAHSTLSGLTAPADDHTQYLLADGTRGLSGDWSITKAITTTSTLKSVTYQSTQTTGTAPLTVASTTVVTNLNADQLDGNHAAAFLKADGSVNLTGNLGVDASVTIDGVDISAHAANVNAHHSQMTISDDLNNSLLSLSTQALDLDTQTANYVFAGPVSGAAAKPTFRAVVAADIDIARTQGSLVLVNGQNNNVTLTDGVNEYVITGPTGVFGFSGFTGGVGGRTITILNNTIAKNMTAYHQTTSTAANQIWCSGSLADTSTSNYGVMVFTYFATLQRWVLVSVIS
jgi:hypothetical protein